MTKLIGNCSPKMKMNLRQAVSGRPLVEAKQTFQKASHYYRWEHSISSFLEAVICFGTDQSWSRMVSLSRQCSGVNFIWRRQGATSMAISPLNESDAWERWIAWMDFWTHSRNFTLDLSARTPETNSLLSAHEWLRPCGTYWRARGWPNGRKKKIEPWAHFACI